MPIYKQNVERQVEKTPKNVKKKKVNLMNPDVQSKA